MHGSDTQADLFGVVVWILGALFLSSWALYALARHGPGPVVGLLILLGLTSAFLGYRRARSLRAG